MHDFYFEKWYMDACDSTGQALVGYAASVRWGPINLNYNGFTFRPADSKSRIIRHNSFRSSKLPLITPASLEWQCEKAKGSWKKCDEQLTEVLLDSANSSIIWNCVMPKAAAEVSACGSAFNNALGYVEKITLTIPPWKIPIQQLFWGRFLSDQNTIIWIRWVGQVPKNLLWFNGKKIDNPVIREDEVLFDGHELRFENQKTLRKGTVLSTVFAKFPLIAKLFPGSIMTLKEHKWASHGVIRCKGKLIDSGKTIHEIVIWP